MQRLRKERKEFSWRSLRRCLRTLRESHFFIAQQSRTSFYHGRDGKIRKNKSYKYSYNYSSNKLKLKSTMKTDSQLSFTDVTRYADSKHNVSFNPVRVFIRELFFLSTKRKFDVVNYTNFFKFNRITQMGKILRIFSNRRMANPVWVTFARFETMRYFIRFRIVSCLRNDGEGRKERFREFREAPVLPSFVWLWRFAVPNGGTRQLNTDNNEYNNIDNN
jgi:hypothetical protein